MPCIGCGGGQTIVSIATSFHFFTGNSETQKHQVRSLAAHTFSVTAICVTTLEKSLEKMHETGAANVPSDGCTQEIVTNEPQNVELAKDMFVPGAGPALCIPGQLITTVDLDDNVMVRYQ